MELVGKAKPYLGEAGPWMERAVGIFAFNEPVGTIPVPPVLDAAAVALRSGLTSEYFPLKLHGIDLGDLALSRALVAIAAAPLIWNLVAHSEYHGRVVSRMFGKYGGAYLLALWIFSFSLYRDMLFLAAMESQPTAPIMKNVEFVLPGLGMYAVGCVLVASSMLRLGITGTYLGDHFGILMRQKVMSFPFSWFDHPMYDGATLCFMGKSFMYVVIALCYPLMVFSDKYSYPCREDAVSGLTRCDCSAFVFVFVHLSNVREESPAGVFMTLWIYIVYQLASAIEE